MHFAARRCTASDVRSIRKLGLAGHDEARGGAGELLLVLQKV